MYFALVILLCCIPNSISLVYVQQQQHDRPAACVVAQQYSSSTFVSLSFHSCKEKFGALFNFFYLCTFLSPFEDLKF